MSYKVIDEIIKDAISAGEIAGANCLAKQGGKELFYYQEGYADIENGKPIERDTIFRLYSMTKPITSAAVMLLAQEGKIDFLDPVGKYLNGFQNQGYLDGNKVKPLDYPMTIKDLLSMTSGLCYPGEANLTEEYTKVVFDKLTEGVNPESKYSSYTTVAAMNDLGRKPLAFKPGSRWNYSAGADVLGALIEVVSGKPFSEFLSERIFEPLGMTDTGFYVPEDKQNRLAKSYELTPDGLCEYTGNHLAIQNRMKHKPSFESGGAGLCATIDDYMKFMEMLINKGVYNGRRVLSERAVSYMTGGKLTSEQQPYMNWDSLEGYTYSNLLRVMEWPERSTHFCTKGEYGWDGWLGVYMMNVPSENLSFVFMTQRTAAGTLPIIRKIKNAFYSIT